MRKLLALIVITGLLVTWMPVSAMAGDTHAVQNRWAGAAIGVAAATLGGLVLGSLYHPPAVVAAPQPVVAPPPFAYSTPPPVGFAPPLVVVAPPPVVYTPAPAVLYRGWGPPHYYTTWHGGHGHHEGWHN